MGDCTINILKNKSYFTTTSEINCSYLTTVLKANETSCRDLLLYQLTLSFKDIGLTAHVSKVCQTFKF